MEKPFRGGERHQHCDLPAATRLTEDRDVPGVAAELADVVTHPLEREHQVRERQVHRPREALVHAGQPRQPHVSQGVESVSERDDDHVVLPRQFGTVVEDRVSGTRPLPTAMEPDHHRPPAAISGWCPHVEPQAVLVHWSAACQSVADFWDHRAERLPRTRAVFECVGDARPWLRLQWWLKPISTRRGRTVADAFERQYAARGTAANASCARLDDRTGRGSLRANQCCRGERGKQD